MNKLFCFASRNLENIRRGYEAGRWAVATVSASAMAGRITKAKKYMEIGSYGLLYCNPTHSFTVPFIVRSKADPDKVETDIWPEPWVLPFDIEPLSSPDIHVPMAAAQKRWPILRRLMPPYASVSAALHITGTTVFVPVEIGDDEWGTVLADFDR